MADLAPSLFVDPGALEPEVSAQPVRLFGRACRVILDTGAAFKGPAGQALSSALSVEGLRTVFKIKKTLAKEPNTAEIQLYNLSQDSRASLHSKGTKVILEAGYTGSLAGIFSGDSRFITHAQEGADWVTKVDLGDGERVYGFVNVAESFRPGTKVKDVAGRILDALGVDGTQAKKTLSGLAEDYLNGRVVHGNAAEELSKIVASHGFELSFQDGKPQVLANGSALDGTAILLSPDTGLVGSPEYGTSAHTPPGTSVGVTTSGTKAKRVILKAKSLLQPALRCGGLVALQSRFVNGNFRVETVVHTGDSEGRDWYSELELSPIS